MKIGVLIHMTDNIDADFAHVKELGFDNCQLACWKEARMTDENAEKIKEATAKYGIEITAFWCGVPPIISMEDWFTDRSGIITSITWKTPTPWVH